MRASCLREALAVPALGHLRPGRADPEEHPPAGDLVERRRGHRRHRRRAARHLEDRGSDLDLVRVRREPREHGRRVGAVGLRGPEGVVPGGLRFLHESELFLGRQPEPPIANVQANAHLQVSSQSKEPAWRWRRRLIRCQLNGASTKQSRRGILFPMRRQRRRAQDLRLAIDCLPTRTREAMLEGLDANNIIVGGYTSPDGGVCPMLAAHRNGGRTSLASFARAWDRYTGAFYGPRPATDRELRTLKFMLETSLIGEEGRTEMAAAIADLKASKERRAREADRVAATAPAVAPDTGERDRTKRAAQAPRLGVAADLPPLRHVQGRARRDRGRGRRRATRASVSANW